MSYQQSRPTGDIHKLTEFVPTYVPHSEYLPTNRVVDSNQADVQQWVTHVLFSSLATNNKKEQEMSSPKDLPNSILKDTSP
jgi:hypothetical protein